MLSLKHRSVWCNLSCNLNVVEGVGVDTDDPVASVWVDPQSRCSVGKNIENHLQL